MSAVAAVAAYTGNKMMELASAFKNQNYIPEAGGQDHFRGFLQHGQQNSKNGGLHDHHADEQVEDFIFKN